jgi:predicted DNA-binding transcriptional regulator YafY
VRVKLRVRVCPELEAWILGFGSEAEVVRPAALRGRMVAHARGLMPTYRRSATGSSTHVLSR